MIELLLSSSVLILVLAILRLALRGRISARLKYALWLLVLVRLLVPVSFFHSPVSVAEAAAPVAKQAWAASHTVLYTRNGAGAALPVDTAQNGEAEIVTPGQAFLLRDALLLTWYAGMAVMAVWFLFVNLRLARQLRRSRTPYDCRSAIPVYMAEGLPSPCLFGLFKPSVYLTEQAASDPTQAWLILAHERTHYRHGDILWALLRSVCLTVWWFDPLVWLAAALSRQDCELACDEGAIKALGEDARFDYGRALVGMAKVGPRPSDLLCGATTMTTGKNSLRERIARIARKPKTSLGLAAAALLIAAIAVGCTFSGGGERETIADPDNIPIVTPSPETAPPDTPPPETAPPDTPEPEPEPEILGAPDRVYWEEVDRELADFVYPSDIEVYISEGFDEALPEDDLFGPLTLEDYIYSTDSWQFDYDSGPMANDPLASLIIQGADGRQLWIMEDADTLMIQETDGSVTWARMGGLDMDCAALIRRLLPWARGEYPTEDMLAAQAEQAAAKQQAILDELGSFGLADQEPYYRMAYVLSYDPIRGTGQAPWWTGGDTDLLGMDACLYYAAGSSGLVDLDYGRFYLEDGLGPQEPTPSNAEAFARAKATCQALGAVTDGLTVNGYDAFLFSGSSPTILWYDTDAELIFSLTSLASDDGRHPLSPEELLALAETVAPM